MRTTLILNDNLITKAAELTGITEKTKLIHVALEELVQKYAAMRLASLGGTMPGIKMPARRKHVK